MNARRVGMVALVVSLGLAVTPHAARATDDRDGNDVTLVGTWRETITFPGVPIDFSSLIAFHADGTVTERFASGPAETLSIGVWKKVRPRTFAVTMENFEDRDRDGGFDIKYRIRATYHVIDRDTLTGTATLDNLSVDGSTEVAPSFPGTTIRATRMRRPVAVSTRCNRSTMSR